MTANQIREKYLKFFEKNGHKIISPAPLVLKDDPSTLFTSAGMQPLVPYLMGQAHPEGNKLTNSQPCFRANDIEEVGDNRHTTSFEMLGNWSLGDYFKKEQIPWFYEFLTTEIGIDPRKLYVSVFEGTKEVPRDEEAANLWKSVGISEERIFYYGAKKNWWSLGGTPEEMPEGEIGGPDTEVFYEFESIEHDSKFGEKCHPNCDCGRFLEIGNSVFIQYKKENGKLVELPQKNVDFGGGLERIAAAVNDDPDVFKIDIFAKAIAQIEEFTGKKYEQNKAPMRIIADHLRASCFLMADEVEPSNKRQGYVLRRLIRRAVLKLRELGFDITDGAISTFTKTYKEDYKAIEDNWYKIKDVLNIEAVKFAKTISKGLQKIEKTDPTQITEEFAFDLFQSEGFPFEITQELVAKKGINLDKEKFAEIFKNHQELSRSAYHATINSK